MSPCCSLPSHFLPLYLLHLPLCCSPLLSPLSILSPLLSSLLPLFRLCKVQLGVGAFGLQAWRQEDTLSEYALLGSLCVTLYFFALLFYFLLFYSYCIIRQVLVLMSSCRLEGVSAHITGVLQKSAVSHKVRKPLITVEKVAELTYSYFYTLSHQIALSL